MFRELDPNKLIKKRGKRPRSVISKLSGNVVTTQDIYAYENGLHQPSKKKLAHLLKGLDATYEEVSEPVELIAA